MEGSHNKQARLYRLSLLLLVHYKCPIGSLKLKLNLYTNEQNKKHRHILQTNNTPLHSLSRSASYIFFIGPFWYGISQNMYLASFSFCFCIFPLLLAQAQSLLILSLFADACMTQQTSPMGHHPRASSHHPYLHRLAHTQSC